GVIKKGGRIIKVDYVGMENAIRLFVNQKFNAAVKEWEKIDDTSEMVKTFIKIMEFVLPKKRSVEFKPEEKPENSLEARLAKLLYKPDIEDVEFKNAEKN